MQSAFGVDHGHIEKAGPIKRVAGRGLMNSGMKVLPLAEKKAGRLKSLRSNVGSKLHDKGKKLYYGSN